MHTVLPRLGHLAEGVVDHRLCNGDEGMERIRGQLRGEMLGPEFRYGRICKPLHAYCKIKHRRRYTLGPAHVTGVLAQRDVECHDFRGQAGGSTQACPARRTWRVSTRGTHRNGRIVDSEGHL